METTAHSRLVGFLSNPGSYGHKPRYVKHIQTHASHVFIVPPYVYKIKKPVNLGFLDFSTLKKRKYYCEKEVKLNRRLCDIYLGVTEVSSLNGQFVLGKGEDIVEYAVKMRRLPERYFLKSLLKKGRVSKDDLLRVVEKISQFYQDQPVNEEITKYGTTDRIKINIYENFLLSERFIGKTISKAAFHAVKTYNNQFFEKRSWLFEERVEAGRIKDCHGDLHLEHINLSPRGVCIYDCIEFNDRFRYIDIASDVAFLAMDLDFNGHYEFSKFIVSEISARMRDHSMHEVLDFYKCYRAYVRGKVESIKSSEPEIPDDERSASIDRAKRYFRLALRYALFGSLRAFIVVFGLVGTGKSTLARALSQELSCQVISSDLVRKEIMGVAPTERRYEGFDEGIYVKEVTDKTYQELLRRGKQVVNSGEIVILDASFSRREFRELLLREAKDLSIQVYFIQTSADDVTIKKRLMEREGSGESISDARLEIFERFKGGFEKPNELARSEYTLAETGQPPEETVTQALAQIVRKGLE